MTSFTPQPDPTDSPGPEPISGDLLPAGADARSLYYHVFGGPLAGKKGGRKNFVTFTAGPVPKAPDAEVRTTNMPGENGELFTYLGSFTHDPTDADLDTLKPKEYR